VMVGRAYSNPATPVPQTPSIVIAAHHNPVAELKPAVAGGMTMTGRRAGWVSRRAVSLNPGLEQGTSGNWKNIDNDESTGLFGDGDEWR